jgi:DNA-binding transcriptional LysR family regulator
MDKLEAMAVFVRAVERGSFSAVARDIASSQPNVSKMIRALELSLGGRLFARSTRKLALTDEGERFYAECRQILAAVDAAEHSFKTGREEIAGALRVASSVSFGRTWLAPRLDAFLERHPGIRIHLQLSDRNEDLVGEGIDVAFRFGALRDSSLVSRPVGDMQRAVFAAPSYLARHGKPLKPADLLQHNCLVFTLLPAMNAWTFAHKGENLTVSVKGNASSNSSEAIREMVLAGTGVSLSLSWQFEDDLKAGRVVKLLPAYRPPPLAIHAVFPNRRQSARVAAFVDYIVGAMPALAQNKTA